MNSSEKPDSLQKTDFHHCSEIGGNKRLLLSLYDLDGYAPSACKWPVVHLELCLDIESSRGEQLKGPTPFSSSVPDCAEMGHYYHSRPNQRGQLLPILSAWWTRKAKEPGDANGKCACGPRHAHGRAIVVPCLSCQSLKSPRCHGALRCSRQLKA
jgi:hypothetical protein